MDPPGVWQTATAPDGRTYYYNTQTKKTQWSKPVSMLSQQERTLVNSPQSWKESTAADGRKYWYNALTRESTWEIPDALKTTPSSFPQRPPAPAFVAGGTASLPQYSQTRDRDEHNIPDRMGTDRQIAYGQESARGIPLPAQLQPEYSTTEEAEAAFFKLLRRSGVQPDWAWEQALRVIVKDPQWRAIRDAKERRASFDKYVVEVRMQEKDREKERLAKLRADFGRMLKSHPEIKHYTRWKTAKPILEGETIFRSAKNDDEARQIFEEYIIELKKTHQEEDDFSRKAALDELRGLLNALDLEPYTRWSEAQDIIQSNERVQDDKKFKFLTKMDILDAFQTHIKSLERSFNDKRQKEKNLKVRRERQNRDLFRALLQDLKSAGKIKAGTKWMEIHPLIEDDPRFTAMLGQAGSTPLDLFWDMVEEEESALRTKKNDVFDVLDDKRFEVTPTTTFEEFMSAVQTDRRVADIDHDSMAIIFERIREKVLRRNEEDRYHAERQQRRAIDNLRSRIKHLDPPVRLGDTWEQVRPRIEKLEEYRALNSDELRRSAFEKVVRRLKEKEEEYDRERSRRDHRDRDRDRERDRDRDRERDRDYRNGGHSASHRRHRTRTPEVDAYEADRKKAQADRERQYFKSGTTGLSPPYRRDRDDRYDRYDRGSGRQVSQSHYDRERREREVERERSYISRADPRDKSSELDYGDSRPSSVRRRRDSDGESPQRSKRTRRDRTSRERTFSPRRHRSKTPALAPPPPKEDPGVRSGSEEGEIEED